MQSNFVSLAKEFLISFLLIIGIIIITSEYSLPCDFGLNDKEWESYLTMCPYGDAVVETKDGKSFDVQCVNYNPSLRIWEFALAPSFKNLLYCQDITFKQFKPSEVKVYTMDGELTVEQAEADLKNQKPLNSCLID